MESFSVNSPGDVRSMPACATHAQQRASTHSKSCFGSFQCLHVPVTVSSVSTHFRRGMRSIALMLAFGRAVSVATYERTCEAEQGAAAALHSARQALSALPAACGLCWKLSAAQRSAAGVTLNRVSARSRSMWTPSPPEVSVMDLHRAASPRLCMGHSRAGACHVTHPADQQAVHLQLCAQGSCCCPAAHAYNRVAQLAWAVPAAQQRSLGASRCRALALDADAHLLCKTGPSTSPVCRRQRGRQPSIADVARLQQAQAARIVCAQDVGQVLQRAEASLEQQGASAGQAGAP